MFNPINACFGGKVSFKLRKWNNYEIQLLPYANDLRALPFICWIPYFWDSDIVIDIGVKIPNMLKEVNDEIKYSWELRDLDGNKITRGGFPLKGNDTITITNKGFRRKLRKWNSGKTRAIILGNLHPHREYLLFMKFRNDFAESNEFQMASLTIADRSNLQVQLLMGISLILFTIIMTFIAKGCEALG